MSTPHSHMQCPSEPPLADSYWPLQNPAQAAPPPGRLPTYCTQPHASSLPYHELPLLKSFLLTDCLRAETSCSRVGAQGSFNELKNELSQSTACCVTLGKSLNLSELPCLLPYLLHERNGLDDFKTGHYFMVLMPGLSPSKYTSRPLFLLGQGGTSAPTVYQTLPGASPHSHTQPRA